MKKLILALTMLTMVGCNIQEIVVKTFFTRLVDYFEAQSPREQLQHIKGPLYSFYQSFDRNLIVEGKNSLLVIDPFNKNFVRSLKVRLKKKLNKPVDTLIYSHYHLDHVKGGAALGAKRILAHRKVNQYWLQLAELGEDQRAEIAPPTRLIEGDQTLNFSGVEIRLIHLGNGHSDTLYAFYFPQYKVLFAPDMGFVRTIPPGGLPHMYYPGYAAAMKKLASINFEIFVPSHFQTGNKQDFLEYRGFLKDLRAAVVAQVKDRGRPHNHDEAEALYSALYPQLKKKYGHWHGFDAMILPNLIRQFTGVYLGY